VNPENTLEFVAMIKINQKIHTPPEEHGSEPDLEE